MRLRNFTEKQLKKKRFKSLNDIADEINLKEQSENPFIFLDFIHIRDKHKITPVYIGSSDTPYYKKKDAETLIEKYLEKKNNEH